MRRAFPTGAARVAGVALLPAVLALCCPGQAAAGCGDYLQFVGPDGKVHAPMGHDPQPAERPCHGPECTGGPRAPAPVPPPPAPHFPDAKALVDTAADPNNSPTGNRPAAEFDGSPVRRPTPIFHPPRS